MAAQKLKTKIIHPGKGGIGMVFDIEFIKTLLPSDHLWLIETDDSVKTTDENPEKGDPGLHPQGPVRVK